MLVPLPELVATPVPPPAAVTVIPPAALVDVSVTPDPSRSLKSYAQGLEYYRVGKYRQAEEQFIAAIRDWNQDARYMYYLGLSRWSLGEKKVADADQASSPNPAREVSSRNRAPPALR